MKLIFSLFLLMTQASFAKDLENKKLKEEICKKLKKYNYQISLKTCPQDGFFFITDANSIEFDQKNFIVEMDVKVELKGSLYFTTLYRSFTSRTQTLSEWEIEVARVSLGLYDKILIAQIEDSNVKEITNEREISRLPKSILSFLGDTEYSHAADFYDEFTYYKILDGPEVIGFLAHQWFESKSEDIKGYTLQSFDSNGLKVGTESTESFNFYE